MKLHYLVLGLILGLSACEQPSNPTSNSNTASTAQNKEQVAPAKKKAFLSYGEGGAINNWPSIEQAESTIAEDLLAKNYYIVLDGSGSMNDRECSNNNTKMTVAKKAINDFVDKLPRSANVGIYSFDASGQRERLAIAKNNPDITKKTIKNIRAGGGTPLSTSVDAGIQALTKQAISQLGYGEYHLVIVTDGIASVGYAPDLAVKQLLKDTPIVVHTIGFCIDNKHSLNKPGYTLYKGANNPNALMAGLESVLAESPQFDVDSFEGVSN
ncbi:MAG: VWA domain-containing protein [Pseudomonadales bacterium]|nr:VWA domain-containing protein [Pseudomonadales bacterium]